MWLISAAVSCFHGTKIIRTSWRPTCINEQQIQRSTKLYWLCGNWKHGALELFFWSGCLLWKHQNTALLSCCCPPGNEKVRLSHIGYTHPQMTMLRFTALEKTSNQTHLSLQLCVICLGCYKGSTCCWLPSLAPAGRVCYCAIWLWKACFSIRGHSKWTMHFYYIILKYFFLQAYMHIVNVLSVDSLVF